MEIQCKFVTVDWDQRTKLYTCYVTTAEIKNPIHKIEKFVGDHEEGKSNEDVNGIRFDRTDVEYFPRNLQQHFPNLTILQIDNCGLKRISKQNLKGLDGLTVLIIEGCRLRYLPDNLLEGLPKLRGIFFRGNDIEFASSKLLQPLTGRENLVVDLRGNKNINAKYSPSRNGCLKFFQQFLDSIGKDNRVWVYLRNRSSLQTLQMLMNAIDAQCKKPVQQLIVSPLGEFKDFNPKIADLWASGRFSDLSIVVGDKQFKVHKNVLGMQNATFAKIIEDHSEATEMKFDEFTADAVEALLHFIYTGEILNGENAKKKFVVADKFQVAEMRSVFEEILFDQLNSANALDIFTIAHATSSELLKENAFAEISEMFPKKLSDALMEDPEKVKRLIEHRKEFEAMLHN